MRFSICCAPPLPVAASASWVPGLGHRLSLLPYVEKHRCLDLRSTSDLQTSAKGSRSLRLSVRGDYGWTISEDHRAWRDPGFDAHKCIKGRKRHLLVDTLGLPIAARVGPANISDRRAAYLLLGGLRPLFPDIRTVIADAGHESHKLARQLLRDDGWKLQIVKRRQRAFKITGLTWVVERSFAWLGRNRRLSKDYEYMVQTSETLIDIAAIRIMLNRLAPA